MKSLLTKTVVPFLAFVLILSLVACGKGGEDVIKIGLNGTQSRQWEYVKAEAAKEGITIELVYFADYVQPNRALVDGEIQANAFQTLSFMKAFNTEYGEKIAPIGTTILSPMGIYSAKITDLATIPAKGKVTIPNDISNQGRALHLLQTANLITLKDGATEYATIADIATNPLDLEIIPMVANQLPPTLADVDVAVINNNVASDAGYTLADALIHEDKLATSYINVIAVRTQDVADPQLLRIVELFQTDAVAEIIRQDTNNNSIPTFVPINELLSTHA